MEAVDEFRAAHPASTYRAFSDEDRARLTGRVPEEMIALFEIDGFASYSDQLLWSVDPDDLQEGVAPWIRGGESWTPIFRSAFGDLYLWDGKRVVHANIHLHRVTKAAIRAKFLLSVCFRDDEFLDAYLRPGAVERARKQVGRLEAHEAYFWVPAMALGGDPATAKIERGGLVELLLLQAQLAPIEFP